MTNIWSRGVLY